MLHWQDKVAVYFRLAEHIFIPVLLVSGLIVTTIVLVLVAHAFIVVLTLAFAAAVHFYAGGVLATIRRLIIANV